MARFQPSRRSLLAIAALAAACAALPAVGADAAQQGAPAMAGALGLVALAAGGRPLLRRIRAGRAFAAPDPLRLADALFEQSAEAIAVTDADCRILSVNPAFTAITGVAAAAAVGATFRPGRSTAESAGVWASVRAEGRWCGETTGRRGDGGRYPIAMTITAVRPRRRRPMHFVAMFSDLTARRQAEEDLHRLAWHDPLTGLANRYALTARLQQSLAEAHRGGDRLALMSLDLDRFKHINDSLGHAVGDELLAQVAQRLRSAAREADFVARLGGDEFAVALHGAGTPDDIARIAAALLARLTPPYRVREHELHATPSIGVSLFPDDGDDGEALLRNAEAAMYHAKGAGGARVQFFRGEMRQRATERLALERKLRGAAARGELELWYQPQFATQDGRLTGMEALVRWRDPDEGLIAPLRFVPIAEETGLIVEIGDWVIHEACRQARAWLDAGLAALRLSVNLSVRQLRERSLVSTVSTALASNGLAPALLELEITESAVMERPDEAVALLQALKRLGVGIAIDDFGTGHSSLSYLKLFPLDHLKIDRSFVSDIEHDANDAMIVAAAVSLAHNLGLSVIAEGVESAVQIERLRELGCDEVQGYHFSRPLPAAQAEGYVRAHRGPH